MALRFIYLSSSSLFTKFLPQLVWVAVFNLILAHVWLKHKSFKEFEQSYIISRKSTVRCPRVLSSAVLRLFVCLVVYFLNPHLHVQKGFFPPWRPHQTNDGFLHEPSKRACKNGWNNQWHRANRSAIYYIQCNNATVSYFLSVGKCLSVCISIYQCSQSLSSLQNILFSASVSYFLSVSKCLSVCISIY